MISVKLYSGQQKLPAGTSALGKFPGSNPGEVRDRKLTKVRGEEEKQKSVYLEFRKCLGSNPEELKDLKSTKAREGEEKQKLVCLDFRKLPGSHLLSRCAAEKMSMSLAALVEGQASARQVFAGNPAQRRSGLEVIPKVYAQAVRIEAAKEENPISNKKAKMKIVKTKTAEEVADDH
jgi:hypothetical protein